MNKKHLGQNWLYQEGELRKIIKAGDIKKEERIIEIGPGTGYLTKHLLETGVEVIAVEKDSDLIKNLAEKFKSEIKIGKLKILNEDFLKTDLDRLTKKSYKIIANIPYYITGAILEKIFQAENLPTAVVLLVQKEVAERIIAKDKKESILSLSVKAYGQVKIVSIVKRGNFFPPPKVDSAILKIENISKDFFNEFTEAEFFNLIKKGFGQKRKQLKNNLGVDSDVLSACGLATKIRAEDLELSDWKKLITHLKKYHA